MTQARSNPLMITDTVQVPIQSEDVIPSKREQCLSCCKKFLAFLFSTIGLTCLMVGYTIFGGFIFMNLEAPNEELIKTSIRDKRRWFVQRLWNVTIDMNVFYEQNWTATADSLFENYTKIIYEATKNQGWDGKDAFELQWTFAGAMLYSITVITTIGYGHIAPRTVWGRVVTILYAIFGIPLTLLTLTNLGGFMATAFRFLYHNICCGLCCLCCPKNGKDTVRSSTVKYKDAENGDPGASEALTKGDKRTRASGGPRSPGSPGSQGSPKKKVQVQWSHGLRRVLKTSDNKTVTVPIYVSLLLIASYILCGAFLFTMWEEKWDYLIGTYFCFITLTTIGFGDYVPGTSVDAEAQEKLVLCSLYLLFGLALIAMCFDLMQEEARAKFRALGRKVGILKKNESSTNNNTTATRQTPSPSPLAYSPTTQSIAEKEKDISLEKIEPNDGYLHEPPHIITYPRYKQPKREKASLPKHKNITNALAKKEQMESPEKDNTESNNEKQSPEKTNDHKRRHKDAESWEPLPDKGLINDCNKIEEMPCTTIPPSSNNRPPSPIWAPSIIPPSPPPASPPKKKKSKGFGFKKSRTTASKKKEIT